MKPIYKSFFLLLFVLVSSHVIAQTSAEKSADRAFDYFKFNRAIEILQNVVDKDPNNTNAKEKLAAAYRLVNNTTAAETMYGTLALLSNPKPMNVFYYAQFLKTNGKYEDAAKYFDIYHALVPSDSRGVDHSSNAFKMSELLSPNSAYNVSPININTTAWEFSPVYFKDGIVFVSNRGKDGAVKRIDNWTNSRFFDLYFAKKSVDNTFDFAEKMEGMQPNRKYHDGSATFSADFNEIYFTRTNYVKSKTEKSADKIVKLEIFKATFNSTNHKWVDITPLPFNNKEYNIAHPTLSADGKKMYFISDMPGGEGETDIYVSTKEGNNWGAPINLGKGINTPGREMFPYIANDGTLYFSSDGWMGLGGLDVFAANYEHGKWGKVENLGAPINSSKDDFGYVMNAEGKLGYMSSNREGGIGEDDMYAFTREVKQCIEGFVYDAKSNERLADAKIEIINMEDMTTPSNGEFKACPVKAGMKYMVSVSKRGYRNSTTEVTIPNTGNARVEIPLKKNENIDLTVAVIEKDKGAMKGAVITLTDKKTGRTFPCTTLEDGSCIFGLQPNSNYEVSVTAPNPKEGCSYGTELRQITTIGKLVPSTMYEQVTMTALCEGEIVEIPNIYYDLNKFNIRPDAALQLDNFVVPILNKYPNMIIELGSHTDCRSSAAYNAKLSQNRANAAVAYLISKGISASRITAKGYGESALKNGCACEGSVKSNCTELEHQQNRRTEFKIIKLR